MDNVNAQHIYNKIADSVFCSSQTTLCRLYEPCLSAGQCPSEQMQQVLNFDEVEVKYHKSQRKPSTSSVDALTHINNKLCFVEHKGWKLFFQNQNKITRIKIEKQVERYHLQEKLINSIIICEEITGLSGLLSSIPIFYFLVTDIDVRQNPLNALTQNLNYLAQTSSGWEPVCHQILGEKLNKIPNIKTRYIYCKDFDSLLSILN